MAGRPALYNSPEDLQNAIDVYLDSTDKLTICGLAYHLGFVNRQSFYDYEDKPEFTDTIKRARLKIESYYEERLSTQYSSGAIFALKNFGWTDKQEITHEIKDELPFNITISHRAAE